MKKIDESWMREVATALNVLGMDVMKMQRLLFASLAEQGHVKEVTCPSCKEILLIPTLPNIEQSDICPKCGSSIYEGNQMTFENWDAGTTEEEE